MKNLFLLSILLAFSLSSCEKKPEAGTQPKQQASKNSVLIYGDTSNYSSTIIEGYRKESIVQVTVKMAPFESSDSLAVDLNRDGTVDIKLYQWFADNGYWSPSKFVIYERVGLETTGDMLLSVKPAQEPFTSHFSHLKKIEIGDTLNITSPLKLFHLVYCELFDGNGRQCASYIDPDYWGSGRIERFAIAFKNEPEIIYIVHFGYKSIGNLQIEEIERIERK